MTLYLGSNQVSGNGGGQAEIQDSGTVINNGEAGLDAIGVVTKSGQILYDWVGTKEEYEAGIADGSISEDWICWVTDDVGSSSAINKKDLFDVVYKDHVLSYEESFGYAQLGSYVYKQAVLNEHYGYPDFYNICVEEKNNGVSTQTTLGSNTVTLYINNNGRQYYDISNKDAVDAFYSSCGIAWFYGIDEENERIFLPRNDYYFMNGSSDNVGKYIEEGLPSITHTHTGTTSETGAHTHTRGTMNITGSIGGGVINASGATGAFYANTSDSYGAGKGGAIEIYPQFDASRSWTGETSSNGAHKHTFTTSNNSSVNDIYGKSDIVQPKSVSMIAYMVVGNTLTNVAHTTIVEQVNGAIKELTDLTNDSLTAIQTDKDSSIDAIEQLRSSSVSELTELRNNSVSELNDLSDTSNTELSNLKETSVTEITNLYNTSYNSIQDLHDTSYDNLQSETEAGVNRIQQTSNALNQTQVTNCLLEVPQKIKLELNDGVLTLKAGSKVIVPNGSNKFDEVVVNSDINFTYTYAPPTDTPCMLFVNNTGTGFIYTRIVTTCFSGATQPSGNFRNWYNTTENKMYSIGADATVDGSGFSFPIAIITQGSDGVTKSIDHVFNGFGYIGSCWWVDKGVEALISKGYNDDGTINNFSYKTEKVNTISTSASDRLIILSGNGKIESMIRAHYFESEEQPNFALSASNLWYNPKTLEWKYYSATVGEWVEKPSLPIAWDIKNSDGAIIDFGFHLNNAFRAMDYKEAKDQLDALSSETVKKSGDTMTGNLIIQGESGQRVLQIRNANPYNVAPSDNIGVGKLQVADRNSNLMMQVGCERFTDNRTSALLRVHSPADASKSAHISINAKADGTFFTYAPTPPAGDNSTQIATTAWVNSNRTSVGWGVPDYSSGVSVTSGATMSTNGLLTIDFDFLNSKGVLGAPGNGTYYYLTIDGVNVITAMHKWSSYTKYANSHSLPLPVKKGSVVTFERGIVTFYPYN